MIAGREPLPETGFYAGRDQTSTRWSRKQIDDARLLKQKMMEELHADLLNQIGAKVSVDKQDKKLKIDEIKVLFILLTQAYSEMKNTVLPQLPLELALLEWSDANVNTGSDDMPVVQKAKQSPIVNESGVSVSSLRKQVGTIKRNQVLYGDKDKKAPEPEVTVETTTVELMHTSGDGPVTTEWLDLFWKNLIHEMKKENHTVAGLLRGCTIKSYSEKQLIIETSYKFHKERLDDLKTRDALLTISKLLTGNELEIRVQLKS